MRIGAGAWIGSAAVVMADVGRDTVVGAGAVVTKAAARRVDRRRRPGPRPSIRSRERISA